MGPADLTAELAVRCGPGVVLDEDLWAAFSVDWTGRWHGRPAAVLRPRSTAEVAEVVAAANRHRVALVPRGGGTGLVGGAVPTSDGDQVVVDLSSLKGVDVDPAAALATVGAGTTLAELNEALAPHGLRFPVDIGSRGSATLGGMVCTNAGGLRMLRYGDTASALLGVEMVTGAGEVLSHMRGLTKDNVGLRWHQLVAGSEGTLGIVCKVLVRLVPTVTATAHAWFPVPDAASAVRVAAMARTFASVSAVEYVHPDGLALVARLCGRDVPAQGAAVVVEADSSATSPVDPVDELARLADALDAGDALVGAQGAGWQLWQWRDRHSEAVATAGVPAKCDVAVPLSRWAELHDRVPEVLSEVRGDLWPVRFGHVADGNLHVNVLSGDGSPPPPEVDDAVFRLVASLGGTVSAEHGIGVAKAPWLHLVRTPSELAALERLRAAFDPADICVPHLLRPAR